ncbi:unnamed protein product [Diplocarpon coronariae]
MKRSSWEGTSSFGDRDSAAAMAEELYDSDIRAYMDWRTRLLLCLGQILDAIVKPVNVQEQWYETGAES